MMIFSKSHERGYSFDRYPFARASNQVHRVRENGDRHGGAGNLAHYHWCAIQSAPSRSMQPQETAVCPTGSLPVYL
jgi:hypothetical protein